MTSGKQPHPGPTSEAARTLHPTAGPPRPWRVRPQLSLAELDAGAPELTRLQMQLLANRGIVGAADAFAYLRASWRATPPEPLGLAKAVARVRMARTRQERVVVFGDYDVDGLTSCALMVLALRQMGIDTSAYLPSRSDDGRGLNAAAVRELANGGASLVVTTDCSTTNVAEVQLATSLGLDVVITDHHAPQGEIAAACAVVNPRQLGCPSTEKNLAGVGVALRVAEALLTGAETGSDNDTLDALLDLVAVGTIGDVVALTKENWRLVRAGLARLNRAPRHLVRAGAVPQRGRAHGRCNGGAAAIAH